VSWDRAALPAPAVSPGPAAASPGGSSQRSPRRGPCGSAAGARSRSRRAVGGLLQPLCPRRIAIAVLQHDVPAGPRRVRGHTAGTGTAQHAAGAVEHQAAGTTAATGDERGVRHQRLVWTGPGGCTGQHRPPPHRVRQAHGSAAGDPAWWGRRAKAVLPTDASGPGRVPPGAAAAPPQPVELRPEPALLPDGAPRHCPSSTGSARR
jgi:hypothetical protein